MDFTLNPALDAHDTRILAELQADARLDHGRAGRRVHLSRPAGPSAEETGGRRRISGYRATVNLAQLLRHPRDHPRGRADYDLVVKLVQDTPECVNAYNVTGEDSWILEIAVIDVATSTRWSPSSASHRRPRPRSS